MTTPSQIYDNKYITAMTHHTLVQIRFNDIDMLGHVNNTTYQQFFDIGRLAFFQESLDNNIDWMKLTPVLVHIEVDYLQPVFLESKVAVKTKIIRFGTKSFDMEQEIVNEESGNVHCRNRSVLVAFDPSINEAVAVPNMWKQKMEPYRE